MHNGISWLPEIINEKDYTCENKINYCKLIEDAYNTFVMDFCNPSSPVLYANKKVVVEEKDLDCSLLKLQNCYNSEYFNCDDCKFKNCFDIFNHICTDDYETLHKNNKNIQVPKLKERKKNRRIPRTPGKFNLDRINRIVWIRAIIENCQDCQNIELIRNEYEDKSLNIKTLIDVSFILKQEKYKIVIKPIYNKSSGEIKYYVLKTAFYMGN